MSEAHRSPEYFARLFEDAPAPYIVTDQNLVVSDMNRAAEELLGETAAEVQGRALHEIVAVSDASTFENILTRVVQDSQVMIGRPLRVRPRRGGERELLFAAGVLRAGDGVAQRICWLFHDVGPSDGGTLL